MTDILWQRIEQSLAAQTMMRTLGVHLRHVVAGEVWLAAPILATSRQQQGAGAGALTFALGDTAAGYAALSQLPSDKEVLTAELKINFLAPAVGDSLLAVGKVVKGGRRLIVVTAEVFAVTGAERASIALLQGTMASTDAARAYHPTSRG
ncbi:MAG: PaaI family thioesterase [Thalassobaculaceae bacterium]